MNLNAPFPAAAEPSAAIAQLSDAAGRCTPSSVITRSPDRAQKHRLRKRDALSFRCLEIKYQLEVRRLLDGELGWVCAFRILSMKVAPVRYCSITLKEYAIRPPASAKSFCPYTAT